MASTLIVHPPLAPYESRYAAARPAYAPLAVTLHLTPGSPLAGYDPLWLDGLLARAVVEEATGGTGLPDARPGYRLPVPLAPLWEDARGASLWAATPFAPVGPMVEDIHYWHKRAQTGRWTGTKSGTFAIRSTSGRWMERRVPLPAIQCATWRATAIGDAAEIARLLRRFSHVGKRRSAGFGEVREWRVEPLPAFALVEERQGRAVLLRGMPEGALALLEGARPEGEPAPVAWTPPGWNTALFAPGWWPGTPLEAS